MQKKHYILRSVFKHRQIAIINIMTSSHHTHASPKQHSMVAHVCNNALTCNTGCYAPPHLLLRLFQNLLNSLTRVLCSYCGHCFAMVRILLPVQKQTVEGRARARVLYFMNKHIYSLGKNNFICCGRPGSSQQFRPVAAANKNRCGWGQNQF